MQLFYRPRTLTSFLFLPSPWNIIVPFHCLVTRFSCLSPLKSSICLPYSKMALREIVDGAKAKDKFSVIKSLKHSVFQNCGPSLFSVYLAPRTPASGFSSHVTMVSLLSSFACFFFLFSKVYQCEWPGAWSWTFSSVDALCLLVIWPSLKASTPSTPSVC